MRGSVSTLAMEENYFSFRGRLFGSYLKQFITDDNYFPYFHLIIAILSQSIIFLALWYDGQQPPSFLSSCPMTILHYYPLLDQLRVASVAIASMLIFDLLLDLYSLKVIFPRSDNVLLKQNSGARWKEFTIRCMFIASFIEQNLIMLSVTKDQYSAVVSIATSHVQNIMIFSMGLFIMSHAFNLAPCQRIRSILLSLIFSAGQVMSFFATMEVCPIKWNTKFVIVRMGLDILPPLVYLAASLSLVKSLILRMRASAVNKNTLNGKEIIFVVNFLAAAVWYILKFTILASQQELYMQQLTASNLVIFDLSVMFFALKATIIRAWLARLESTKARILVSTTKRNVTENLTYPLLEISVGLNVFLASANQAMDIDEAGRKNLSRIALACNMAVNALDDMAYSNNLYTPRTETGTVESRRFSLSSVTRNFDAVRGDTHSTQLPSTTRRRTLPKLVKHHLKERSPHRVAYMIPEDYDSEVSEIHDIQSRMSAKLSTKSANNAEYMTAPGPPSEAKYPQRPSINLLASSNLSQGYLSDENDREHSASSGSILKQTGNLHITRPRPKFNGFHILQEKDEEDVSDDGSVPESAKNNVSSMSSFVFRPAATLSPSLFGTPSADKIHEMDNYFSFPSHDMMSPVDQRCHSSLSAYHSGPKKQETKSARPCSTHLYNTSGSAAELYSPSSSIVSSAVASQLIIAPCTPLQLYCYMPDSGSVGFECPFSTLTATNQNLLDLLVYSQRDTATDTSSNNSSTSFNVTVPKSPLDRTQGPMVTSGNVPREVLFRSLSALVNATFVPIQTAVNGNTGTFLTNRTSDTSKLNRMTGKCDMLSQFTWKLLQVFYWDLKSTINVYEVFLSSFSPNSGRNSTRDLIPSSRTSNRNDTYTSCDALEGLSSGPLPLIFSDPTLLNYEALRNLEEYLSGTLALFVKVINHAIILFFDYLCLLALIFLSYSYQISAFLLSIQASASLLTAVDNVAVMKERRRRGIF